MIDLAVICDDEEAILGLRYNRVVKLSTNDLNLRAFDTLGHHIVVGEHYSVDDQL